MLKIKNLKASVEETEILRGIDLEINAGEVHAIMGPNGSGKSTLSAVIAGDENYNVDAGSIVLENEDLLDLDPDERAHRGVFLSFQYPVEIPGISVSNFMKAAINEKRKNLGMDPISAKDLLNKMRDKMELLNMKKGYLSRNMNEGFSGGEKKRNEIFQMAMLEPKLSILDETDSGLDIDALKIVANGVNKLKNKNNATIIITHYQRLLNYIVPDFVHVLHEGKIIKSGGKELALELEAKGYDWLTK
tara:strand:+ start:18 stop:758 length:741 start_codon:yes stop_codon:yes gene_type:complete